AAGDAAGGQPARQRFLDHVHARTPLAWPQRRGAHRLPRRLSCRRCARLRSHRRPKRGGRLSCSHSTIFRQVGLSPGCAAITAALSLFAESWRRVSAFILTLAKPYSRVEQLTRRVGRVFEAHQPSRWASLTLDPPYRKWSKQ